MLKGRKGISPVIATVIIVAVAIAIAIAVAGWLMGLWATFGTTESLKVMPNSTLVVSTVNNTTSATLTLVVKNTGSKPATINEIEIVGVDSETVNVVVNPGQTVSITWSNITGITPGTQYTIKVYTDSGYVSTGYVIATTS